MYWIENNFNRDEEDEEESVCGSSMNEGDIESVSESNKKLPKTTNEVRAVQSNDVPIR
jgi:hypothetical protein